MKEGVGIYILFIWDLSAADHNLVRRMLCLILKTKHGDPLQPCKYHGQPFYKGERVDASQQGNHRLDRPASSLSNHFYPIIYIASVTCQTKLTHVSFFFFGIRVLVHITVFFFLVVAE